MTTEVSNTDDIIDSRDVIARIEELEALVLPVTNSETGQEEFDRSITLDERNDLTGELKALESLQDEAESYVSDWRHGAQLVRDSYFQEHAWELAEDIGALAKCDSWPATCIDWERAADELKQDYTSVEFDGVTYWAR